MFLSFQGEVKTEEAPALTLKHVGGVFWVTVYGTIFAVVLVFIEMLMNVMKESIRQKKSFWEELKEELKFYLRCRGLVKPVRKGRSNSESPGESEQSNRSKDIIEMEEPAYGFLPDVTNQKF